MEENPYYEQDYQPKQSPIPDPSFAQIFKGLFLYPFTWAARSTRKAFWIGYLVQFVATFIVCSIMAVCLIPTGVYTNDGNSWTFQSNGVTFFILVIEIILLAIFIWIKLGLLGYAVRRLHDSDHSGWWLWLYFIPAGWIVVLVFLILPTVQEPVQWGTYLFLDKNNN